MDKHLKIGMSLNAKLNLYSLGNDTISLSECEITQKPIKPNYFKFKNTLFKIQ